MQKAKKIRSSDLLTLTVCHYNVSKSSCNCLQELFYCIALPNLLVLVIPVAVALAAVAGRPGPLFGMAADTELVPVLLVNAELAWWPVVAILAWVEPHMLGVVEVDVAVVGFEDLCLNA